MSKQQKNSILTQNEEKANYIVAKVMRVTFIILALIMLLDVLKIFIVKLPIMTVAFVAGSNCIVAAHFAL